MEQFRFHLSYGLTMRYFLLQVDIKEHIAACLSPEEFQGLSSSRQTIA
jgi:hypothetical protein